MIELIITSGSSKLDLFKNGITWANIVFLCKFFPFLSLGEAKAAALHHYSKSFQGFSAMITPKQAGQLAGIVFQCYMLLSLSFHYIVQGNNLNTRWKTNSIS